MGLRSASLALVILLLFLLVACNSFSPASKYKYLQQGQTQIRIDEASGRTDRLTNNGWVPISFDSPSVDVPKDQLKRVSATILPGDTLCYSVDNNSNYVLKEIWLSLPVRKSRPPSPDSKKKDDLPLLVFLNSQDGGFAPVGNRFIMCYDSKFDFSAWDTQMGDVEGGQGWKQQSR